MINWDPVLYKNNNDRSSPDVLKKSIKIIKSFINKPYPIILTAGHLAKRTGISYSKINDIIINRLKYYSFYKVSKRNRREYRNICHPKFELKQLQRWINKYILMPNKNELFYEYAYIKGKSTKQCAEIHKNSSVLIKLDIKNYFDSISEISVYKYFHKLGYSKFVSFQLARICTIPFGKNIDLINSKKIKKIKNTYHVPFGKTLESKKNQSIVWNYKKYKLYRARYFGHLPQGAPTSPMLANLITKDMDNEINNQLEKLFLDINYTRYADDIFISLSSFLERDKIKLIIHEIQNILIKYGFSLNVKKTKIFTKGKRQEVLGIIINDKDIHLPKRFKKNLECHLYYYNKNPIIHYKKRHFDTLLGLINYLTGLISYANYIEPLYIKKLIDKGYLLKNGKLDTSIIETNLKNN